jgi:hypothetical protein
MMKQRDPTVLILGSFITFLESLYFHTKNEYGVLSYISFKIFSICKCIRLKSTIKFFETFLKPFVKTFSALPSHF